MSVQGPYYPHFGRWTTRDELHYLAGIGTWRMQSQDLDRRALLLGYREGLGRRRVWAGIDRDLVLTAVDVELRKEARRGA